MSMQRVAIEATLDTPMGLLRVTTTHLEYDSERQRTAQIDRLRELHREAVDHARAKRPGNASDGPFESVDRAAPAILAGDCNFRPDTTDRARLLAPLDAATPARIAAAARSTLSKGPSDAAPGRLARAWATASR